MPDASSPDSSGDRHERCRTELVLRMKRTLRNLLISLILAVCVATTIRLFDWRAIGGALAQLRWRFFLGACLPILFAIFALRGWRWLVVLGIEPNSKNLWHSLCANGTALGLASITPFQLGEIIKIRLIPEHHGAAWRMRISAIAVERMLDLATMCAIALAGFSIRLGYTWAAPVAMVLPTAGCVVLGILCTRIPMPSMVKPYIEVLTHTRRVIVAGAITVPVWILYCVSWWVALHAMNVLLDLSQVAILMGGVMIAVAASMTPGGIGVAELSSRGLLIWLGTSPADAEIGAIALRLLTPLLAVTGFICLMPLLGQLRRKK